MVLIWLMVFTRASESSGGLLRTQALSSQFSVAGQSGILIVDRFPASVDAVSLNLVAVYLTVLASSS